MSFRWRSPYYCFSSILARIRSMARSLSISFLFNFVTPFHWYTSYMVFLSSKCSNISSFFKSKFLLLRSIWFSFSVFLLAICFFSVSINCASICSVVLSHSLHFNHGFFLAVIKLNWKYLQMWLTNVTAWSISYGLNAYAITTTTSTFKSIAIQ